MKQPKPTITSHSQNNLFLSTGKKITLVLLASLLLSVSIWFILSNYYTGLLTRRAATFALAVDPAEVQQLKKLQIDDSKLPYTKVKQKLTQLKAVYEEARFVYIMAYERNETIFLADSEPADSLAYSARGDVYDDPTTELKGLFKTGSAFTEGPVPDEYGIWYSSLAPIKDSNGNIIAIIGIDVPAVRYIALVAGISLMPLLIGLVSSVILSIYDRSRYHRLTALMYKSELASLASHELKDPIDGLRWAEESLLKSTTEESQRKLLHVMYESTLRLQENLENVVQLANVGPKADKLSFTPINLADCIKQVVQVERLSAEQKGVYLSFSDDWPAIMPVYGNAIQLRTVFNTILSNAIRDAREQTPIELSYTRDGKNHVVHIRGQGLGIAAIDLPHVFERTYRASNPIRRSRGGGMGLFIAHNFIEQHNGKLWIESIENSETIAHISLPVSEKQ